MGYLCTYGIIFHNIHTKDKYIMISIRIIYVYYDYHTMDYPFNNIQKIPKLRKPSFETLKKSKQMCMYYKKEPYFQTVPKIKEAKISHRKINGSFFMTLMPSLSYNSSFPTFCILYNSAVVRRLHSATAGLLRAGRRIDRRPTSPYEPGSQQ